jgi:AraC family transcriptional activator of mtrCDE
MAGKDLVGKVMVPAQAQADRRVVLQVSKADLNQLFSTLEVDVVRLTECVVSPGFALEIAPNDLPGIHYSLAGTGRLVIGNEPAINLPPHTLFVTPPKKPFRIEVEGAYGRRVALRTIASQRLVLPTGEFRRIVAGEGDPQALLICGYFRAIYGSSVDLFSTMISPIVESFEGDDRLDHKLQAALDELTSQEIGSSAMSAALMKQVLVTLLRRSLRSNELWAERFSLLSDPNIARAFAEMIAKPGSAHSVETLARTAGLSRSAFMTRFSDTFGESPMALLRQIRMRHAATLLKANRLSIDQVASAVGYTNRSSFFRVFRNSFDSDPSEYRARYRPSAEE